MHRRTTVLSIVLLLAFFAIGVGVISRLLFGGHVPLVSGDRVAILPVTGIIDSDVTFQRDLERFRDDPTVRAFVVEIRSPGGVAGTTQSMYAELARLRELDDRPIIAWIGEVGASGGYYLALAADSILALPGAITGSIGVIMEFPHAKELLRKVGVDLEVVKSGEHKDIGSPARELGAEERQILQTLVDDVHEQFVRAVEENRELGEERVRELADGRVLSGARAAEVGLVDRTGTLREAVDVAGRMAGLGEGPQTVRPTEKRIGLWEVLFGVGESKVRAIMSGVLDRSLSVPKLRYQWP